MEKQIIISRIHKFLNEKLIMDLEKICNNLVITDNNKKVRLIKEVLDNHDIMYNELGPGTNRYAVSIDGYVFKIAMDKWGKQDNANEFTMSKELQPFVVKVYENNDLISVCEYVTLISREEFLDSKHEITEILSTIGESYLMGDVGYVEKNFTNWGYRDDGQMTILDFAYIHNIEGREMLCVDDGVMLDYSENFHYLRCPKCSKKYSFSEIRRKIPIDLEWKYINDVKNESYHLMEPHIYISEDGKQINKPIRKEEEDDMNEERENIFDLEEEEIMEGYNDLFEMFANRKPMNPIKLEEEEEEEVGLLETDEDEDNIPDDPINAVDILRAQAEEMVEAAERIEEVQEQERQQVEELEEEVKVLEDKLEEAHNGVMTLEEALSTTNFNAESTVIERDEANSVKVNVVTPSSGTQVNIEVTGEVDLKIGVAQNSDEVKDDGFMSRMNQAYIQGQSKLEEENKKEEKSSFTFKNPDIPEVKDDLKYQQMAKDLGYEVD